MSSNGQIDAATIEDFFWAKSRSLRCILQCGNRGQGDSGYPVLSEKPGPDGSIDGEWTIKGDIGNGLAIPGWNVFQFKARGLGGTTRRAAINGLKGALKGAAIDLAKRLKIAGVPPAQYILFTNLQLGLETPMLTANEAVLSDERNRIESAIREGATVELVVTILDAGNLAAEINANASLRFAFFAGPATVTWEEKLETKQATHSLHVSAPFVGRDSEMKELAEWIEHKDVRGLLFRGRREWGKLA